MQNYYEVKDLDEGSNYLDIFNALYVSDEKLSYDDIVVKFFVTYSSLQRFVKRANSLAEKINKVK